MFQPTTECADSLTIDDVTGQAVPESGTGRTECSVADGCKPRDPSLSSFGMMPASDRQTVRQTDGFIIANTAHCMST